MQPFRAREGRRQSGCLGGQRTTLDLRRQSCSCEQMRANRLRNALAALGDAMQEVNAAIEEMPREHDPLASHNFVSRRLYQKKSDTKSGKRHRLAARLSWQEACELISPMKLGVLEEQLRVATLTGFEPVLPP